MPGFIVTFRPAGLDLGQADFTPQGLSSCGVSVAHAGVEWVNTKNGNLALIDGCALGIPTERLATALEALDDDFLSGLHGHYSALILHRSGEMWGFCDRIGGRTLYWAGAETGEMVIASRWNSLPSYGCSWSDEGLTEMLRYRWMSGTATLLTGISQLPVWHRVSFSNSGQVSVLPTRQPIVWPSKFPSMTFNRKLDQTRSALVGATDDLAASFPRAAIFLSGGVDSALLAALAKSRFRHCLLVTPVFSGIADPEVDIARDMGKTLGLEHLFVEFDESKVEEDLRDLVHAKGGQVNFASLAFRQMMRAVPDNYELIIYGEAADITFGSTRYLQTVEQLRRKQLVDLLPAALLERMSRRPHDRFARLWELKQKNLLDVLLRSFQIPYPRESLRVIESLCNIKFRHFFAHLTANGNLAVAGPLLRGIALRIQLQNIAFRSNIPNHFREAELSASHFGKLLFSPFMALPVLEAAKTLTADQYYGRDYVKPVLRDLACEHFDRKWIYREKHAFDVPHIGWLRGPLAHLVEAVRRERTLFDGSSLRDLDLEQHCSLFWTLICWLLVYEQVQASARGSARLTAKQGDWSRPDRDAVAKTPSLATYQRPL